MYYANDDDIGSTAKAELNTKCLFAVFFVFAAFWPKIVTNTHADSLHSISYTYPHAFLSVPPSVTETDCETD